MQFSLSEPSSNLMFNPRSHATVRGLAGAYLMRTVRGLAGHAWCTRCMVRQGILDAHGAWSGRSMLDAHGAWSGRGMLDAHGAWSGRRMFDAHGAWSEVGGCWDDCRPLYHVPHTALHLNQAIRNV